MPHGGSITCYKTTPPALYSGGGGTSSTGGHDSSVTGHTSLTNIEDARALKERSLEIYKYLKDNSLIYKTNLRPWAIIEINRSIRMINDRDAFSYPSDYIKWYNLKRKVLIELKAIKAYTT